MPARAQRRTGGGRTYWLAAAAMVIGSVLVTVVGLCTVDLHLHANFMEQAGFNSRGYRGPVIGLNTELFSA